jgi:hypothetical protein
VKNFPCFPPFFGQFSPSVSGFYHGPILLEKSRGEAGEKNVLCRGETARRRENHPRLRAAFALRQTM